MKAKVKIKKKQLMIINNGLLEMITLWFQVTENFLKIFYQWT